MNLSGKRERLCSQDVGVNEGILFKWVLNKCGDRRLNDFSWFGVEFCGGYFANPAINFLCRKGEIIFYN
jgi:hypothetical protein